MPIQRKKGKNDPDTPYCDSKRPSKHDLETRVVNWAVSTAKNGAQWTDEEQITSSVQKSVANWIGRLSPDYFLIGTDMQLRGDTRSTWSNQRCVISPSYLSRWDIRCCPSAWRKKAASSQCPKRQFVR